jgi:hypothetical protein
MKILRLDEKTVALEEIDSVVADLLRKIAPSADPTGSEAATARLFPRPTGGREPTAEEEWREYVEPDLRELFRDAVGVVEDDLKNLPATGPGALRGLNLPVKHLEAWIHALNQARLALAARHDFTEHELERDLPLEGGPRSFVLFQIHFYGLLQEFFLRQLD